MPPIDDEFIKKQDALDAIREIKDDRQALEECRDLIEELMEDLA